MASLRVFANVASPLKGFARSTLLASPNLVRGFSASVKDVNADGLEKLKVNSNRMNSLLHKTCALGPGTRWGSAPTETGMSRLSLGDADKEVRDWFVSATKELGCDVKVDVMGNIFAVRPGKRDGPPTVAGSHLDTQPNGGRYDGILGILAGVEMLQVLKDHQYETEFPVGVVNWTNEEGARFPISMVSSGVWAEKITLETAHAVQEAGGTATLKSELERIGYLGSIPANYKATPMAAHFELHIEQGPILETQKQKVGVVQGAQAYRWFTVDVKGRDAHTGTTPLSARGDALLLAARIIAHSHRLATKHSALAATGLLSLLPGSVNTIPGQVRFSLDIRSPRDEVLDKLEAEIKRDAEALAAWQDVDGVLGGGTPGLPLAVSWETDFVSPATHFDPECIETVRAAAKSVTSSKDLVRDMTSGAGHDSVQTNSCCPSSMIFVPSKNGVSHNPEEYTSPEDCALGAEVLLQSVVRYDRLRALKAN